MFAPILSNVCIQSPIVTLKFVPINSEICLGDEIISGYEEPLHGYILHDVAIKKIIHSRILLSSDITATVFLLAFCSTNHILCFWSYEGPDGISKDWLSS